MEKLIVITNKREYLEAIRIRRQLCEGIAEDYKTGAPPIDIAEPLVDILSLMLTCYEQGAETTLTIKSFK